jgi:hypothetical protein
MMSSYGSRTSRAGLAREPRTGRGYADDDRTLDKKVSAAI